MASFLAVCGRSIRLLIHIHFPVFIELFPCNCAFYRGQFESRRFHGNAMSILRPNARPHSVTLRAFISLNNSLFQAFLKYFFPKYF